MEGIDSLLHAHVSKNPLTDLLVLVEHCKKYMLNYAFSFPSRISDYMDLTPVDIIGKRCYQFIHAEDVEGIRHSHLDCK